MQSGVQSTVSALMVAAGLLASIAPAQAQQSGLKPSWYLSPHATAFDPDDSFGVSGHGYGGGLRLGKPIANDWDLQLDASHVRRSVTGRKIEQSLLGVEALFLFSRSELQPFVSFGVGAERDARSLGAVKKSGTAPFASVGLGVRWMFDNNLGVQLDYRRVQGFLRNSDNWGFDNAGNNYYNLGLIWNFGVEPLRPAAPKVVAAAPAPVVVPPPPPKVAAPPPPPPPPQTITLDATRLFELNSARLIMPVPQLDSFASALQSNPQVSNVMITGHTDQLGSAAYNQGLSQRRAESVKAYLVSKGIAASRLTAQGVASTRLVTVCNEKTRAAMIKCGEPNRRVVIEPITVPKRQ
jgi:OmpA-OmpF porin, OOP family